MTISFYDVFHAKRFEPVKRKHGSTVPEWQGHRFPIKGGISLWDTWLRDISRLNPLYKLLNERAAK